MIPLEMITNGRSWQVGSDYRYGFNAKEQDDDVAGNGNEYDYGFRVYNPRLGKFLSVDPLFQSFPWWSPYVFSGNTPIQATDLDGREINIATFQKSLKEGKLVWQVSNNTRMATPGPLGNGYLSLYDNGDGTYRYIYGDLQAKENGGHTFEVYSGQFTISNIALGFTALDMMNLYSTISKQKTGELEPHLGAPISNSDNPALNLLNSDKVTLATEHSQPTPGFDKNDDANVDDNLSDAANGLPASTSPYSDVGVTQITLSEDMLNGLNQLSLKYSFTISEIAGGDHTSGSRHYNGVAADISVINGIHVSATNPYYKQFMLDAKNLGATEILGPGDNDAHKNHVHIAWPRQQTTQ